MELSSRGGRNHWLRSGAKLIFEANWLTSIASAVQRRPRFEITSRLPGVRFWSLVLGALLDLAWLATWWLIAIRYNSMSAIFLASFPVLKWLLLLVAWHSGQSHRTDLVAAQSAPTSSSAYRQPMSMPRQPDFSGHETSHGNRGELAVGGDAFGVLVGE